MNFPLLAFHWVFFPAFSSSLSLCSFKYDYILALFPKREEFWEVFYLKRPCGVERWFPVGGVSSL